MRLAGWCRSAAPPNGRSRGLEAQKSSDFLLLPWTFSFLPSGAWFAVRWRAIIRNGVTSARMEIFRTMGQIGKRILASAGFGVAVALLLCSPLAAGDVTLKNGLIISGN